MSALVNCIKIRPGPDLARFQSGQTLAVQARIDPRMDQRAGERPETYQQATPLASRISIAAFIQAHNQ